MYSFIHLHPHCFRLWVQPQQRSVVFSVLLCRRRRPTIAAVEAGVALEGVHPSAAVICRACCEPHLRPTVENDLHACRVGGCAFVCMIKPIRQLDREGRTRSNKLCIYSNRCSHRRHSSSACMSTHITSVQAVGSDD